MSHCPILAVNGQRSPCGSGARYDLLVPGTLWPEATFVTTARLRLEPLRVDHAREIFPILNDIRLHFWTGGSPCSLEQLEAKFRRQSVGQSADGACGWLNWILRRVHDEQLVGTLQATIYRPVANRLEAELAWVIGTAYQGNGYGREGALAMADWLRSRGIADFTAHIHPKHDASMAIARALGLSATQTVVDGEICWSSSGR